MIGSDTVLVSSMAWGSPRTPGDLDIEMVWYKVLTVTGRDKFRSGPLRPENASQKAKKPKR